MKKIIFGFSKPIKFKPYAALIMWADDINYSHAYTKFLGSKTNFIYQNSGHQTNFKSQTSFLKSNIEVEEYELDLPCEHYDNLLTLCADREGKDYGVKQVIGKAIVKLAQWILKKDIANPFADGDSTTDCIEEQSIILTKALGIEDNLRMDDVSVKAYRDWLVSTGRLVRIK